MQVTWRRDLQTQLVSPVSVFVLGVNTLCDSYSRGSKQGCGKYPRYPDVFKGDVIPSPADTLNPHPCSVPLELRSTSCFAFSVAHV